MKKKHGLFFGFAVLLITAILTLAGCDHGGGGGDDPELAKWAGTWNSFANYVNEPWLNNFFTQGATAISQSTQTTVTADQLKGIASSVFATPFKSFVIQGDTITFYSDPNAGGTGTAITYTYRQKDYDEEEEDYWYYFEGGQTSAYKYLIALPPAQDSSQTPVHFHFQYAADKFDTATTKIGTMSQPVGIKQETTNEQIIAQFQVLLTEINWAAILASLPQ
jgi:Zn/Cd-binding protein ZinT